MKKRLIAVIATFVVAMLGACNQPSRESKDAPPAGRFSLLAGSELKDVESDLKDDIRKATGLDLAFTYSGTLDAADRIAAGEPFDALWVSHGKYLAMNDALKGRIVTQEKTMLSPVLLGLKASKAHALGWDTQEPTWKDIADAAKAGKFTFGMTNPTSSNTGLTATIGLAAALAKNPDAKFAVLSQNDDYGRDYLLGLKDVLGQNYDAVVTGATYEVTDPTIDSQMIQLKNSGANVFFNISTPKFAAQAIKKAAEIGWKPAHYINNVSTSIATVMKPAGFENAQGIISAYYLKDPTDAQYAKDKDFIEWKAFMQKYYPTGNVLDASNGYAYAVSNLLTIALKQCGDDLTRANVMKQAANLKNIQLPMVLEGIKVNTSATDYYPIQAVRMARFKGETWELFGDIIAHEGASN